MIFRRKGYLRKEFDEKFLQDLRVLKGQWMQQKDIVSRSFEVSGETLAHLQLTEAKYFYAIKEARRRNIKMVK